MARDLTNDEELALRSDRQWSKLFLWIDSPKQFFTARLASAPSSDDRVAEIEYEDGSAAFADAIPGQTVYVGSEEDGYDKGMVRLRGALPDTTGAMEIGETSEIDWAVGDYLSIVDEFGLWPRHLRITADGTVYMDWDVAYDDNQHDDCDPVPVLGPPAVVWLTGVDVDVAFDASDSWVVGSSIDTYAWDSPDGGEWDDDTSATPTLTLDAPGRYRVSCTVTALNGKAFTGYRLVRVFQLGVDEPTTDFALESCSGDWQTGGWSFRVTLYDAASLDFVRDRALVVLFAEDHYGDDEISIGPVAGRENIIAVGWIDGESIEWNPELGQVSFDVHGPHWWLGKMYGFPCGIEDSDEAPAAWTEFENLTLDKGLWHFLHWRTTATAMMDVVLSGDEREIAVFEVAPSSLWEQMNMVSQSAILAHPACDRYGRLFVEVDLQLWPSHAGVPIVRELTTVDWIPPLTFERVTVPETAQVDLSGVAYTYGAAASFFSLSPGHVPARFGKPEVIDRLALSSQSQANTLAGLVLGRSQNRYPHIPINLAANDRTVDICPAQYLQIDVAEGDTVRGFALTDQLIIPRTVSFEHDSEAGVLLTKIVAEAATEEQPSCNGDIPACKPISTAPVAPPSMVEAEDVAFVGTDGGGVYVRSNAGNWSAVNTGLAGDALTVYDLAIDPDSMGEGQAELILYITTLDGLYKSSSGGGLWAKVTLPEPEEGLGEPDAASVKVRGSSVFVLAHLAVEERAWLYRSDDGGDTWDWREISVDIAESDETLEDTGGAGNYQAGRKLLWYPGIIVPGDESTWAVSSGGAGARYRDDDGDWADHPDTDLSPTMDVLGTVLAGYGDYVIACGDDGALYWTITPPGTPTQFVDWITGEPLLRGAYNSIAYYGNDLFALSSSELDWFLETAGAPAPRWYRSGEGAPFNLPSGRGGGRFVEGGLPCDSQPSPGTVVATCHVAMASGNGYIYAGYIYDVASVHHIEWVLQYDGSDIPCDAFFEYDSEWYIAAGAHQLLHYNTDDWTWELDSPECPQAIQCATAFSGSYYGFTFVYGTAGGIYAVYEGAAVLVSSLPNVRRVRAFTVDDTNDYILAMTDAGIYLIGPIVLGVDCPVLVPYERAHIMDVDTDGVYVYMGLLTDDGFPMLVRIAADLESDASVMYGPGAGSWVGVQCDPWDADVLHAFGDFNALVKVARSENNGGSWTNQTPAGWDSGELVGWVLPSAFDGDDLLAALSVAEEVWHSGNGGEDWSKRSDTAFGARSGARGLMFVTSDVAWTGNPETEATVLRRSTNGGLTWATSQPAATGINVVRLAVTIEQGGGGQNWNGYCE